MRTSLLLLALILGACGDRGRDTDGPDDPTGQPSGLLAADPVVEEVHPQLPLSLQLVVETTAETTITVDIDGQPAPHESTGTRHEVPILGIPADSTAQVHYTLTTADGESEAGTVEVETRALPADFPRFELLEHQPDRMQPGYTVAVIRPGAVAGAASEADYVVALDDEGQVVWLYLPLEVVFDGVILPEGNLMFLGEYPGELQGGPIVEMSLFGEELVRYQAAEATTTGTLVDSTGFHHEARRLEDGRTLTLTKEAFFTDDYAASYADPTQSQSATVSADVVVEFDASGAVTGKWYTSDWLPTRRIGYAGLEVTNFDGLLDWTHGNAVDYDPQDDTIIVSLRNQNAVVKLDREGDPVWILGVDANWPEDMRDLLFTPDASVEWFYHQHAPMLSDDGQRVLLFDNGEVRNSPWDGTLVPPVTERYSRLVEYEIDVDQHTVKQTWELKDTGNGVLYSPVVGDADYLPNGNILGCFGYVTHVDGVPIADVGAGSRAVRLVEADPAADEVVWDLRIYSNGAQRAMGWTAYRAQRIDSLYGL